jgi:hypothetical protein
MVRFRLRGDPSSTTEGSVAGESVPIADRWSLGKGLALTSLREIAIFSVRFASVLKVRPPEFPTIWLCAVVATVGEMPAPSSDCTLDVRRKLVDNLSATDAFSSDVDCGSRRDFDV